MIRRLLLLNGLATVCVVLYHASAKGFVAMFWWTHRYLPVTSPNFDQLGSLSYYALRTVEQFIIFTIPAFLFVSGFFIAFATKRTQRTIDWKLVGARIRGLLIPYLFWSMMIFLGDYLQGEIYSVVGILKRLAFGGAAPPYYYVPLLIQLYIISPVIVPFARDRWKPLLLITGIVNLAVVSLQYGNTLGVEASIFRQMAWVTRSWFFPGRIFWFTFGIVVGFHLQQFKYWVGRMRRGLLTIAVIALLAGIVEWELLLRISGQKWLAPSETIIDNLYAGAFILSFLAFDKVSIPFSRAIDKLGGKSFGIYLIHEPVLQYASRAVYFIAPWLLAHQILFQPILIALGLGIPLLLMAIVRRSPARGLYVYLFN